MRRRRRRTGQPAYSRRRGRYFLPLCGTIGAVNRSTTGMTPGRVDRHRPGQLRPAARRDHRRTGQRRDHRQRAAAGVPAELTGGQGFQPHSFGRPGLTRPAVGRPPTPAIAGDAVAATAVAALVDSFGDVVDAGPPAESWRFRRDTPALPAAAGQPAASHRSARPGRAIPRDQLTAIVRRHRCATSCVVSQRISRPSEGRQMQRPAAPLRCGPMSLPR